MINEVDFLGRGFSFPPKIDKVTGRFVMASGDNDVKQSIYIILTTKKNEYAMLPEFGSDLFNYVFGLPDPANISLARESIIEALTIWEPRIEGVDVSIDMGGLKDGKVIFDINYFVRSTNAPANLVFPYYLYDTKL